jgi:hypothetical protein
MSARIADISPGDICCTIMREGNAICNLLSPSFRVKSRLIESFLTDVDVYPTVGMDRKYFCKNL